MIRILLSGCNGHMGRVIRSIVAGRNDCCICAGVDINPEPAEFPVYTSFDDVTEPADVVIDFSHTSVLSPLLAYAEKHPVALVLCTTGYSAEQTQQVRDTAKKLPVFYSRNMSIGINLLIGLAKKAAQVLGDDFDIEIIEKHHNQKIDAPSGTALMIADAIAGERDTESKYVYDRHSRRQKREKAEIGLHAVRGGTIVGEHEVIFAGNSEVITLSHSAQSKEVFAAGAVNAAVYMAGKPAGLYDMADLI